MCGRSIYAKSSTGIPTFYGWQTGRSTSHTLVNISCKRCLDNTMSHGRVRRVWLLRNMENERNSILGFSGGVDVIKALQESRRRIDTVAQITV